MTFVHQKATAGHLRLHATCIHSSVLFTTHNFNEQKPCRFGPVSLKQVNEARRQERKEAGEA